MSSESFRTAYIAILEYKIHIKNIYKGKRAVG